MSPNAVRIWDFWGPILCDFATFLVQKYILKKENAIIGTASKMVKNHQKWWFQIDMPLRDLGGGRAGRGRAGLGRAGPGRAEPSRADGQCVRYSILPSSCTLQRASRLRETHDFKKLHSPTSVSSTRNAHFQNQVSSRLRETLLFLKKWRLAYTKHLLWVADHAIEDGDGWGNDCKCIL